MSVGSSPLVSDRNDPDAPRLAMFGFGGRYERAFTPARPSVRGFGRVLMGGNFCPDEESMEEPDPSCDMPEEQRSVGVVSLALGVALTGIAEKEHDELTPTFGTVGLAVVYTHASDEAIGSADFLGIELSCGFGGDLLTPFMRRDD